MANDPSVTTLASFTNETAPPAAAVEPAARAKPPKAPSQIVATKRDPTELAHEPVRIMVMRSQEPPTIGDWSWREKLGKCEKGAFHVVPRHVAESMAMVGSATMVGDMTGRVHFR